MTIWQEKVKQWLPTAGHATTVAGEPVDYRDSRIKGVIEQAEGKMKREPRRPDANRMEMVGSDRPSPSFEGDLAFVGG